MTIGRRPWVVGAGIALAYMAAAQLGLQMAVYNGNVSLIWPASGVALAVLVLTSLRHWPGLAVGAFVTSVLTGAPAATAVAAAIGVTLAAVIGAWGLKTTGFRRTLDAPRDLALLWVIGGAVAALVSSSLGVAALRWSGIIPVGAAASAWRLWYLGDAFGVALFAPFVLSMSTRRPTRATTKRVTEVIALFATVLVSLWLAFVPDGGFPYLPFIPLLWAVARFDLRVISLLCATVALFAAWATTRGRSQFTGQTPQDALVETYSFVIIYAGIALGFGVLAERDRRTNRALRSSEARFRTVFRNSPVATAIASLASNRIVAANEAFREMFDLPRGEEGEVAQPPLDFWTSPVARARYLEAVRSAPVRSFAADVRSVGGTVRHALVSGELVQLDGGPHVVSAVQDISEFQSLQRQLFQAQRMESIGNLAGGISHDFNNLLTVMIANADFALRALPDGHEARADILEIRRAVERGASLTQQLLAFSRRQAFAPRVFDLNAALADMQRMLARVIAESIRLRLVLAPNLATVRADPTQIEQVVMNLVVNSRDAMPHGGALTIETTNIDAEQGAALGQLDMPPCPCVMLSIADTGGGMDEATRLRAFEPFFTTKDLGKGTGLGLSTVYGIVKQSGGTIILDSEPGVGTTVRVFLPSDRAPAVAPMPAAMPASGGSETILLVEDDESIREIVRRILADAGYNVLSAGGPIRALEIAEMFGGPVDLVLSDVVMPEMTGPQLVRTLADRATAPSAVRVLFMSGYTDDAIAQHGVGEPDVNLLAKPFDSATLLRSVRRVLDET